MNVSLTPELKKLIQEKVTSGLYNSASEVVREALRLLQERDELREVRLETLRREISQGIEAADRGELVPAEEVFGRFAPAHSAQRTAPIVGPAASRHAESAAVRCALCAPAAGRHRRGLS